MYCVYIHVLLVIIMDYVHLVLHPSITQLLPPLVHVIHQQLHFVHQHFHLIIYYYVHHVNLHTKYHLINYHVYYHVHHHVVDVKIIILVNVYNVLMDII